MKLIVGLGNPGKEYSNTRHNLGFMVIDFLAEKLSLKNWKNEMNGTSADFYINNEKVIFLKPQKFINLSGEVIKKYLDYYKINIEDIIVINDDIDLKLGRVKLVQSGGSAGHNGLKNIEKELKTQEYKRIRIGVGTSLIKNVIDHVLGKISKKEKEILEEAVSLTSQIVIEYFDNNFMYLMNKYNKKEKSNE